MQSQDCGELVQLDHITEGKYKHFSAICPIGKSMHNEVYDRARSEEATDFLELAILNFPYPIKSLQVDGGSEFRGEFEKAAKRLNIPLYVLPPRSSKLNGCVERSHQAALYEFYGMHRPFSGLDDVRVKLKQFLRFYNEKRPHQYLNYLTPMRYYQNRKGQQQGSVSYV